MAEKTALPESTKAEPKEKLDFPAVIVNAADYDRAYRYLSTRYHILTPVVAFSGIAPQHGLVTLKVLIDSDPEHNEVYQDKLFCRTGSKDSMDDEVALAKVGLRKLALAGGWNLSADVLVAERNHWVIRGYNRFVGLDGSVQTFSATEEYDMRDGSAQIRHFTPKQVESMRAHGLRGAEGRALNAACREYGIRQKYSRRELQKPFIVMRMMFIPDTGNEMQMRIVTERALQGTAAMFPQTTVQPLEPIEGMKVPVDPGQVAFDGDTPPTSQAAPPEPPPNVPEGYTLIQQVKVQTKKRRSGEGTFEKWVCIDMHGEETVTVKKDFGKALIACWNQEDWRKGRPVEIVAKENDYREHEILEINPLPMADDANEGQLPLNEEA
jgi:hypothetical protein